MHSKEVEQAYSQEENREDCNIQWIDFSDFRK
jgi:hypothetical protein